MQAGVVGKGIQVGNNSFSGSSHCPGSIRRTFPAHFPGRPDSAACVSLPRNYSTDFLKIYSLNENKNSPKEG